MVREYDATPAPELLVVNKTDAASGLVLAQLRRALTDAVFVSAHTGDGIDRLRSRMAELVVPTDTTVDVTIPYDRGELVARVHADGRIDAEEHTAGGHQDQGSGAGRTGRQPERLLDVLAGVRAGGARAAVSFAPRTFFTPFTAPLTAPLTRLPPQLRRRGSGARWCPTVGQRGAERVGGGCPAYPSPEGRWAWRTG